MALKLLSFILLLFLAFCSSTGHAERGLTTGKNSSSVFDFIKHLGGCHKGKKSKGIQRLKLYLTKFGYLPPKALTNSDYFDDALESAVKTYQKNFRIKPSGVLDATTVSTMMAPRCGVPDIVNGTNHMQPRSSASDTELSHYSFFPGSPKWSARQLAYKFTPYFNRRARPYVRRAFAKWSAASGYFNFYQVASNEASDLSIGFYRGDHGDGYPFDGPGGVLAHSYAPSDGRFHYDAEERWSLGPLPNYFDLETVALHEIGHLLGLGHSQDPESVMYPSLAPGTAKDIQSDDVRGIRDLYNI